MGMLEDLIGAIALRLHDIEANDHLHCVRRNLLDNGFFVDRVQALVALSWKQALSVMYATTLSTLLRINANNTYSPPTSALWSSPSTFGWSTLMLNILMNEVINIWICCSCSTMSNFRICNKTKVLSITLMAGETKKVMTHQSSYGSVRVWFSLVYVNS